MAACLPPAHQGGDSSPPVCSCKQLRDCEEPATATRHYAPVRHQFQTLPPPRKSVILSRVRFRVLLANAGELIEMQTRNDSSDPRSSSTFYERYHSLDDVSPGRPGVVIGLGAQWFGNRVSAADLLLDEQDAAGPSQQSLRASDRLLGGEATPLCSEGAQTDTRML